MGKKINWAKALESLAKPHEILPEGDGWFTVREFAKNTEVGLHRTYEIMNLGLKDGTVEKFHGSVWSEAHRQRVRKNWYRLKNWSRLINLN